MENEFGLTGTVADLMNPRLRDKVVQERQEAGLGKERYGVVCGIQDPETRERCNKRICPQGWVFAVANPQGGYCLHIENYSGGNHEDITEILQQHGLPWRPLMTKVNMKEATDKNLPKKKRKKRNGTQVQVTEHGTGARDGANASVDSGSAGGHESPPRAPSLFRAYSLEAQQAYQEELTAWQRRNPGVQPDAH